MARWRLKQPHYLTVPGTTIQFEETNRDTGRKLRKDFPVPLFLNPEDPGDQNYPQEGMIVVAQGKAMPRDIIFEGPPTPDMEPLDDEAQTITAEHAKNWTHPIEGLEGSYADQVWKNLEAQLQKISPAQSQSLGGVSQESFNQLQQQVTMLIQQNTELVQKLSNPAVTVQATGPRRV